jgi:hypothetical protein
MYSYLFPNIKKVLSSNPVLMMNYHKTQDGIKNFAGYIKVVLGEHDHSASLSGFIDQICDVTILKGVDHEYRNNLETFINLPEQYLFI